MTWEIGGFRGAIGERVRNWCSDRRFFETISWGESPNLFGFPFSGNFSPGFSVKNLGVMTRLDLQRQTPKAS